MPRIPTSLEYQPMRFCGPWLGSYVAQVQKAWQQAGRIINGQLSFGDGLSPDNIAGRWVDVVTPGVVNTDFTVTHNLGRLPVGYWIMQKDKACDVYQGGIVSTLTQLTLKASVATATLKLFII
jgi:hypothetical protein